MKDCAQSHIGFVGLVLPIELRHQIVEPNLSLLDGGVEDFVARFSARSATRELVTMAWSGFHDFLLVSGLLWKPFTRMCNYDAAKTWRSWHCANTDLSVLVKLPANLRRSENKTLQCFAK